MKEFSFFLFFVLLISCESSQYVPYELNTKHQENSFSINKIKASKINSSDTLISESKSDFEINILNGIYIPDYKDYIHYPKLDKDVEMTYINPKGYELKYVVIGTSKIKNTVNFIEKLIIQGNDYIEWEKSLSSKINGIDIQFATIIRPNKFDIYGYRSAFVIRDKFILITSFTNPNTNVETFDYTEHLKSVATVTSLITKFDGGPFEKR